MRSSVTRTVLAATAATAVALTGACTGSNGGDDQSSAPTSAPHPSSSNTSQSAAALNKYPFVITNVSAKSFARLNRTVPGLPGVQNTTKDDSTVRVFMKPNATAVQRNIVVSQLKQFTGRTAVVESSAPPLTLSPRNSSS